jgi:hypothetical protein
VLTRMLPFSSLLLNSEGGGGTPPAPETTPLAGDPPAPTATTEPPAPKDDGKDAAMAKARRDADEAKRRADEAERKLADRDRKDAEEQGRWKELAETEKARADGLEQKIAASEQDRQIESVAKSLKFRDPDLVKHLLPANVDKNDTAQVKTALEQIASERKHLIDGAPPPPSGGPTGGPNADTPPALTREQLKAMTPQQIAALEPKDLAEALKTQ